MMPRKPTALRAELRAQPSGQITLQTTVKTQAILLEIEENVSTYVQNKSQQGRAHSGSAAFMMPLLPLRDIVVFPANGGAVICRS